MAKAIHWTEHAHQRRRERGFVGYKSKHFRQCMRRAVLNKEKGKRFKAENLIDDWTFVIYKTNNKINIITLYQPGDDEAKKWQDMI